MTLFGTGLAFCGWQEWAVPTELSRAIVGGKTVAAGAKLLPGKGAPECGRESLFLHSHHAR